MIKKESIYIYMKNVLHDTKMKIEEQEHMKNKEQIKI